MAFQRPGGWLSVTNFGTTSATPLPQRPPRHRQRTADRRRAAARDDRVAARRRSPAGERRPARVRRAPAGCGLRGPADRRPARRGVRLLGVLPLRPLPHDGRRRRPPGPTDSWLTLAGLARETSTIRLGTLVTSATFRHPGPLAISVAQVDQMSGGRVELGLGAGWFEAEHRAYGLEFPDVRTRFDRFEEQLAVITGLWRTPPGETFSYAGEHYLVDGSPGLPKPFSPYGPPIIIGGQGKRRTPELAARYAAEYNVGFASVDDIRARLRPGRGSLSRSAVATPGTSCSRRRWPSAADGTPPRCGAAPTRADAISPSCATPASPARPPSAWRRSASMPPPAPRHLPPGARPRRPRPPRPRGHRGHAPGVGPPERVRARLRRSRRVPPKVTFGAYRWSRGHFWRWTVITASQR